MGQSARNCMETIGRIADMSNAKPVLKPGDHVRARVHRSWTPAMIVNLGDKPLTSYIQIMELRCVVTILTSD